MAQKPKEEIGIEISLEADEKIETEIKINSRINKETGVPVALYGMKYELPQGTPEEKAMYYLQNESKSLGISTDEIINLRHHATRTTGAGSVVRYRQYSGEYPVNNEEVTISISPQNKVVFVMNSYKKGVDMQGAQPTVSKERAYQLAYDYLNVSGQVSFKKTRTMVYTNKNMTRLAQEVIISTGQPLGEWHVFVDANTEEIFKIVDMAYYCNDDSEEEKTTKESAKTSLKAVVDGTGFVFNPDPLSSNTAPYAAPYLDNNDATNASFDAARFSVTLNNIDETGGVYTLKGPFAEIVDHEAPTEGVFSQATSDFSFNRQDQGFEAANVYYHIDFLMNYINNTLGITLMPYQYAGGVQCDPHGLSGADNSHYTSGDGRLAWGEGGVDDAEDSDVIHHELGHGLHDWVTSGGLSQVNGLSEGCGDYIAQSYNRSLGNWATTDAAYNWVFNWDGHNAFWAGRITNVTAIYPAGLGGGLHADGQLWATSMMLIWDAIGQQESDIIFYEGLGMTNGSSNQNDAANAVYQAAIDLSYTSSQLNDIYNIFTARGYTLPAVPGPPVAAFSADNATICLDDNNTVNFTDDSVSVPAATSWSWTFEGGTPATSTDQNPVVTYAADGTYDVTLMVTNANGNDTLVETDYISVVSGAACPACTVYASPENLNIGIPDGTGGNGNPGAPAEHIINVSASSTIDYVTVNVDISHGYINDLIVEIKHPNGTIVSTVFNRECASQDDINVNFIDGLPVFDCSATTGDYMPSSPLSVFSGLDSAGDWTISVTDNWDGVIGTINDWSIEVCSNPTVSIDEHSFDNFSIYPNPNNGTFDIKLNSTSTSEINVQVYDISGRTILNNSYENTYAFEKTIKLNAIQSGVYLIKVSDGERESIDKIIIK